MTITKAFKLLKTGQIKNGDIVKWQGLKDTDTGLADGGYLYAIENGGIVGKQIRLARNRKEAIIKYREQLKGEK